MNDDYGTFGMPNVSGALILPTFGLKDSYTKIRSSYGYAVTAPTPANLYHSLYGNPDLTPEKVKGFDIGVDQEFSNGKVKLSSGFFYNDYTNLIAWSSGYKNIATAETKGVESSIKIIPCRWLSAQVNHTYTKTNDGGGQVLHGVPKTMLNYLVTVYPHERLSLYVRGISNSSRATYNGNVRGFLDTAVGGKYRIGTFGNADVYAWGQLNNLLDKDYEVYPGYKHPGIHFTAGVSVKYALGGKPERL